MKKLKNLAVTEVSLVDKAANKKKFLVYKSKEGNKVSKDNKEIDLKELIKNFDPKIMAKIEKRLNAVSKMDQEDEMEKSAGDMEPRKDSAAFKDDAGEQEMGLSDRAKAALKATARILAPFKDEINDSHVDAILEEIGIPGDEDQRGEVEEYGDTVPTHEMKMDTPEGVEDKDHGQAMDYAQKAYQSHLKKMGYRKYPDQQPQMKSKMDNLKGHEDKKEEGVSKSEDGKALDLSAFPTGQRVHLEAIFKSNQELVQKNADLEKQLKEREEKEVEKEIVVKAESFKHLGVEKTELLETLRDAKKAGEKTYGRICKQFELASAQIEKAGLFKEIGTRQSGVTGNVEARIDALVDSIVQKSNGTKSREQIYAEVLMSTEGQRLYAEMKSVRPGGI